MTEPCRLPFPNLNARQIGARCFPVLTDEALFEHVGVRVAFSGREGGVSEGAFFSLNVGLHVSDNELHVLENRKLLLTALGGEELPLIVPHQVHGKDIVSVNESHTEAIQAAVSQAALGADALIVGVAQVAVLLCFADCVSVFIVSPTGRFAVVHAGWRGVVGGIAFQAVNSIVAADKKEGFLGGPQSYNVYIGPHIRGECFETGQDVRNQFAQKFGEKCLEGDRNVSLASALQIGFEEVGIVAERMVDAGICTVCSSDRYFSYRAQGGIGGRHGAIAFREAR